MADTNGITKLGRPRATTNQYIERFLSKIKVTNKCWEWKDKLYPDGYGGFFMNQKSHKAHRISFLIFKGNIKNNYVIDHICRNRKCVNPDHLRQVTKRINALENSESICAKYAKQTHCKRGHILSGNNVSFYKNKRKCKTCNKLYARKMRAK